MGITGRLKPSFLTPEKILEKITEYDIFKYYMPNTDWEPNVVTFSPFRNERNPSFMIGNKQGRLTFIDFADTSKRGSCFDFVKMSFNLKDSTVFPVPGCPVNQYIFFSFIIKNNQIDHKTIDIWF